MNNSLTHYLQQHNALGALLPKLQALKQWNAWLVDSLGEEVELAQHCFIANLAGNSFIVIADSPIWVTRFRFRIPEVLAKLRTYPGLEKVQAMCCKVQPSYTPHSSTYKRPPQQRLSAQNAQKLREEAKKVKDSKLRAVLERIAGRSR
jgi:hypothetical protein